MLRKAAALLALLPAAAAAEEAGIPAGCALQATLVRPNCEVHQVLICEGDPADQRALDAYLGGTFIGEEVWRGPVMLSWRRGAFRQIIEVEGLPVATTPGAVTELTLTRTRKNGAETLEEVAGTRTITAGEPGTLDFADGTSRPVLSLHSETRLENGELALHDVLLDRELGVGLSTDYSIALPGEEADIGTSRVVRVLLPGDPGFGETDPVAGSGCTPR